MRNFIAALILILLAAPYSKAEERTTLSTPEDRVELEIVIYKSRGQIKDTRVVRLSRGGGELKFEGVASMIDPGSVSVTTVDSRNTFNLLDQSYAYDLLERQTLMERYVGQEVKIIRWHKYTDTRHETIATLVSNEQEPLFMIDGEIRLREFGGQITFPHNDNVAMTPTLTWIYGKGAGIRETLLTSYLANGLFWNATYAITVDPEEKKASLSIMAGISNYSGAPYKDAMITLVAGDVALTNNSQRNRSSSGMTYMKQAPAQVAPLFEYHTYKIERKTTLMNKDVKELAILNADPINVTKKYTIRNNAGSYQHQGQGKRWDEKVGVSFKIENNAENSMGVPLPKGIARVYKDDGNGPYFIGEERVGHTPAGGTFEVKAGNAFDITAKRTHIDFKKLSSSLSVSTWEVKIENLKAEDVNISIFENVLDLNQSFRVLESSEKYTLPDASTIKFNVTVPKGSTKSIIYKIEQDKR